MFLPMMRMERGSSTLPPQAPCLGPLPFLQNKVCAGHINHVQWEAESISWSLLPFWCRSLVLQQSPVQVPRPRPSHSDLTSPGLAQQPDETTHPLPFTSHTEWVQDVLISLAEVYLQSFNPKLFIPGCPQRSMRSWKWSWRRDERVRSDFYWLGGTSCHSIHNLRCQTYSHCSYVLILCLQCGRQGTTEPLLSLGEP